MLAIIEILILALAVIALVPEAPIAKSLRLWLVEKPADALGKLTLMNIVVGLIVVACLIVLMFAPEIFTVIGIADLSASLSAYLDAAIILSLMGAAARLKFALSGASRLGRTIVIGLSKLFGRNRVRNRRPRLRRPQNRPASDDTEPHGNWAFA